MRKRLLASARHASLSAVAGSVLTGLGGQCMLIVSGLLVARLLGPENRGYLALLTLVPVLLAHLLGAGVPQAVTYYVARDPRTAQAVVRSVTYIGMVQVAVILAVHATALIALTRDVTGPVQLAGVCALAAGPTLLTHQYALAVLQGLSRFRDFNVLRLMPGASYAAAVAAIFALGKGNLPVVTLAWMTTLATVAVATVWTAWRRLPEGSGGEALGSRALLGFGVRGLLGSVSPVETFRIDQAIVGLLLSPAQLGLYVVGVAFTNLPRFIAQSVGMVVYPRIAATADVAAGRRLLWLSFFGTAGVCAVVVASVGLATQHLVPLLFGEAFRDAVPIARILLVGALFLSAKRILSEGLKGCGFPEVGTVAELAAWFWMVPAAAVFARRWGAEGVAVAMATAAAFSLVVLLALAVRTLYVPRRGTSGTVEEAVIARVD